MIQVVDSSWTGREALMSLLLGPGKVVSHSTPARPHGTMGRTSSATPARRSGKDGWKHRSGCFFRVPTSTRTARTNACSPTVHNLVDKHWKEEARKQRTRLKKVWAWRTNAQMPYSGLSHVQQSSQTAQRGPKALQKVHARVSNTDQQ